MAGFEPARKNSKIAIGRFSRTILAVSGEFAHGMLRPTAGRLRA
jgi:hypothetical protein